MTTSELELKARRFTARMNRRQLCKLHEIIEDFIDGRDIDRIRARKEKLIPHKEVKAMLGL
ncbi:MAG: hypothetical protein LBK71_00095 [Verrucomicrobiales bacterium]|jgi:hypothetical protein|nr:hypothetical protein [Verrucomicrobiales bacterium]